MKNILVTGANGQLGNEMRVLSAEYKEYTCFFTDVAELDICDEQAVMTFVKENNIHVIVNCAAYTAVDKAEDDIELCTKLNKNAVSYLAKAAEANWGEFIQISTDYVIDTTILRSNGKYYRISKDETDSRLILEESDSLRGDFKRISCPVFEKLKGVEGPEGYLLPEGRSWCVIADQFAEGKGYLPMITEDLSSGDFTILEKEKYDLGRTKKRHGGVLELSDAEYERLIKAEMEG